MYNAAAIISLVLLYLLICGISASVDTQIFKSRIKSVKGIAVGLLSQFLILPFCGFICVKAFDLDATYGITLLAVTCSPGGAFSNWWCSVFNADLALSVAMTAFSTIASVIFMPLNLTLYIEGIYGTSVSLDWWGMMASIVVSLSAIVSGLVFSHLLPSMRKWFSLAGNIAGLALMLFGTLTSSRDEPLWDKETKFYLAVACPCVLGLAAAFLLACLFGLEGPQRVAVSVESCYQNVGVALALALATFDDEEASKAAGVPTYYGLVEIVLLPSFLFIAWKANMTYAPARERLYWVILGNFQPALDGTGSQAPCCSGPGQPQDDAAASSIDDGIQDLAQRNESTNIGRSCNAAEGGKVVPTTEETAEAVDNPVIDLPQAASPPRKGLESAHHEAIKVKYITQNTSARLPASHVIWCCCSTGVVDTSEAVPLHQELDTAFPSTIASIKPPEPVLVRASSLNSPRELT